MTPLVDPRFAATLAELTAARGWSLRQLAREAHVSQAQVQRLAADKAPPTPGIVQALDTALCAGGRLVALVTAGDVVVDEQRLAYLVEHPDRLDTAGVAELAALLTGQRYLDDEHGSAPLVAPVGRQVRHVTTLVACTSREPVRAALLPVAAQWAQFAGWLCTNTRRWEQARSWFGTALAWALEADDPDMVATVLSYEGHVSWLQGHAAPVVTLSQAARRNPDVYPGQLAYDAYQEARGRGLLGDAAGAVGVLAEADDLAAATAAWTGSVPAHQYYRAPWFFRLERGLAGLTIAASEPGRVVQAAEDLAAGLAGLPTAWAGADWAAEYRVYAAWALAAAGEQATAGAELERARVAALGTGSGRVLSLVNETRGRWARGAQCLTDLFEAPTP